MSRSISFFGFTIYCRPAAGARGFLNEANLEVIINSGGKRLDSRFARCSIEEKRHDYVE
jgi:hypothetical protein